VILTKKNLNGFFLDFFLKSSKNGQKRPEDGTKMLKTLKNPIICQNIQISTKISVFEEFLDINMTKTLEM